jgi:hypothetical protein
MIRGSFLPRGAFVRGLVLTVLACLTLVAPALAQSGPASPAATGQSAVASPTFPVLPGLSPLTLRSDKPVFIQIRDFATEKEVFWRELSATPVTFYLPDGEYTFLVGSDPGLRDEFQVTLDQAPRSFIAQKGTSGISGLGVAFVVLGALVSLGGLAADNPAPALVGLTVFSAGCWMAVNGNGDLEED